MSTIGSLAVNVTANTEKFSRGMKTARHELAAFEKISEHITHTITHLGGALAAGLTVHKFIEDVHKATEDIVELSHAAKRLGMSTEAFGGLEHAANLSHISTEQLTKALTKMEKNVGSGADAIQDLHLRASELKNLKADEIFLRIAGAIEKLPTASEKTAAAMAVFGKSGAEMLKLINQGPDGIRAAMAEAGRMGLAPSEEDVKKIEEEDRAIRQLSETYKGLAREAAVYFSDFAKHFAQAASVAMGGDSPGTKAWDRTMGSMADPQFNKMQTEIFRAYQRRHSAFTNQGLGPALSWLFGSDKLFEGDKQDIFNKYGIETNSPEAEQYADAAFSRREKAQAEQSRKDQANQKYNLWFGARSAIGDMGSGFSPSSAAKGFWSNLTTAPGMAYRADPTAFWKMILGGDAFESPQKPDEGDLMADPNYVRLRNSIDEMGIAGNARSTPRHGAIGSAQGNAALEYGSASAFSQGVRSQQQSQLNENAKLQLKTQQSMDKSLQRIDANLKNNKPVQTVDLA